MPQVRELLPLAAARLDLVAEALAWLKGWEGSRLHEFRKLAKRAMRPLELEFQAVRAGSCLTRSPCRARVHAVTAEHAHHYAGPSTLTSTETTSSLQLASALSPGQPPDFFVGRLRQPRLAADLLTAVAIVVGSRFYQPPNAKARQFVDPLVTAGASVLRFEGFSACASTWVRVDFDPASYDGDIVGHGTTNVDFNPPMRQALARVKDSHGFELAIGSTSVTLHHDATTVVEKKVPLPVRWLRSLVEVQSHLAAVTPRATVSGATALRFLRGLPRTTTKRTPLWVVAGAGGLRLGTAPATGAVRFADVQRLRILEPLALRATSLTLYGDDAGQCSVWVLTYQGATLTLALTAEVWRGFSGEGQALRALLRRDTDAVMARVRAALSWQHLVDVDGIARDLGVDAGLVTDCLRILGTSGLVGYDVVAGRYFHRVLPFKLDDAEAFNPRLVDARALVDAGAVHLDAAGMGATVQSGEVSYGVRVVDDEPRCSCPWFAKHQGERGPCKHVLAFELRREQQMR